MPCACGMPRLSLLPHAVSSAPCCSPPLVPLGWRSPSHLAIILDTVFQGRRQKQWRAVAGGQRSAGVQGGPAVLTCTTWPLELGAVRVVSTLSWRGFNTGRMTAWLCCPGPDVRAVALLQSPRGRGRGVLGVWQDGSVGRGACLVTWV